jgi:hypothetical protein
MHIETTHPQCLVPRLPQRLVRGYAVQSVQVLQAATDQRANQTTDDAPDGSADTGRTAHLALWWLITTAIGFCAASRLCAAGRRRRRWRRWVLAFISV